MSPEGILALRNKVCWSSISGLVALGGYTAVHLRGIGLTPDGWAFWQGAVSIVEGKGYSYFSGVKILYWPPLYSLYLAAWTVLFGPYAVALIFANGLLIIAQSFLWMFLYMSIFTDESHDRKLLLFCIAFYVASFVCANERDVLTHYMAYTFLPLFLIILWSLIQDTNKRDWTKYVLAALVALCLLLAHNSTLGLVGGAVFLMVLLKRGPLFERLIGGSLILFLAVVSWSVVRWYFGQLPGYSVETSHYSPTQYLVQGIEGIGYLVAPKSAEIPGFVLLSVALAFVLFACKDRGLVFLTSLAALSILGLVLLFSSTWINDPLSGRFILFVPLLVVPPLLFELARFRRGIIALALCLTVPLAAYRDMRWIFFKHEVVEDGENKGYVAPFTELSHFPSPGWNLVRDGRSLVAPPRYRYEDAIGEIVLRTACARNPKSCSEEWWPVKVDEQQ
jgi:hypothetical protein